MRNEISTSKNKSKIAQKSTENADVIERLLPRNNTYATCRGYD